MRVGSSPVRSTRRCRMTRRVVWACALSVLSHLLVLLVLWQAPHTAGFRHSAKAVAGEPRVEVIQARLLPQPATDPPPPWAAAVPLPVRPRPSKAPAPSRATVRVEQRVPLDGPSSPPSGPPSAATVGPSADVVVEPSPGPNPSPSPGPGTALRMELPKEWEQGSGQAAWPKFPRAVGTPNSARSAGGATTIQESASSSGERRAKVTTPWGSYCMRSRRPGGPHDPRFDRGMVSTTCGDGD